MMHIAEGLTEEARQKITFSNDEIKHTFRQICPTDFLAWIGMHFRLRAAAF